MTKRERYQASLTCPECGRKGTATWEENENPVHSEGILNQILEEVSQGFTKIGNQIRCKKCNVVV